MFESCMQKQQHVKDLFAPFKTEDLKYQKIIELGKKLPPFPESEKISEYVVKGCQSIMYLSAKLEEGKVFFAVGSDALISAGLAAILIQVYSGETPEAILKCPPAYLEELGIGASLTQSRANGLYSIHLRMKQEALKFYMLMEKQ